MEAVAAPAPGSVTTAKPIDEPWHARALVFVLIYRKRHGAGPTWSELYDYMGWRRRRSCNNSFKMRKLAKRGLTWTDEPRSLDVSEEGRAALKAWERQKAAS